MKTHLIFVFTMFLSLTLSAQETFKATTTSAVRLFSDRDDLTSVITIIPSGSTVEIARNDGEYLFVNYQNYQGYIPAGTVSFDQQADSTNIQQVPVVISEPQRQMPASRYDRLMMKYGAPLGKLFFEHKIWKGLTSENVIDSWGKPVKINKTYNDNNVREEWIYTKKWLLFQNDILVDWGNVR